MIWEVVLWVILDVNPIHSFGLLPTWLVLLQINIFITIMITMTVSYEGTIFLAHTYQTQHPLPTHYVTRYKGATGPQCSNHNRAGGGGTGTRHRGLVWPEVLPGSGKTGVREGERATTKNPYHL